MSELKIILFASILVFLTLAGITTKTHYKTAWQNEIREEYSKAERTAIIKRNAEIERVKDEQFKIRTEVVNDYEKQLKILSDRLASAKRDGLRVPKSACPGFAANTEATSTEGNNDSEYVRLPERIESGLFRIIEQAESVKIQLASCQDWITRNGFYLPSNN